jgi:hypothetical protein
MAHILDIDAALCFNCDPDDALDMACFLALAIAVCGNVGDEYVSDEYVGDEYVGDCILNWVWTTWGLRGDYVGTTWGLRGDYVGTTAPALPARQGSIRVMRRTF